MGLSGDGLSCWEAEDGALPLVDTTIGGLLDAAAERSPEREAIVVDGFADHGFDVSWTYLELRRKVDELAKALIGDDVRPGDRVAIWAPNVPQWIVVELAVAKVGAVLVTLNPTYRAAEAGYVLDDAQAKLLFLLPRIRSFDIAAEYAALAGRLPRLRAAIALSETAPPGTEPIADFTRRGDTVTDGELAERQAQVRSHHPAQIQYTSGTTGKPKGAVLTHRGLLNNARQFAARWAVSADDRWANPMPLFHTAGCAMVTFACIANSATHCLAVWFDVDRVLELVQRQRCTILETAPTMVTAVLTRQSAAPRDLSSLRLIGTGGAPVPPELGRRVRDELGTRLRAVYGLTETSPLICAAPFDAPGETGWTTAGPPLPYADVKIVDVRTAEPVPVGQLGQLQVRGYLVMDGYLNRPEETRATIDDEGWLSTGDIARITPAGDVQLVDRIKDIIIRGGENLYPAEIEAVITTHPAVLEACVVGVPDPYYGEEACAVISLRAGATLSPAELQGYLRQRVTHQKVPRHVLFVDEFPTTGSGKIRKRDVARLSRELIESAPAG